jgi:hypothetical protein
MTSGITKGRLIDFMERKRSPKSTLWNAIYKNATLIKRPIKNFQFMIYFVTPKKLNVEKSMEMSFFILPLQ